jgi:hypothetical protein
LPGDGLPNYSIGAVFSSCPSYILKAVNGIMPKLAQYKKPDMDSSKSGFTIID